MIVEGNKKEKDEMLDGKLLKVIEGHFAFSLHQVLMRLSISLTPATARSP